MGEGGVRGAFKLKFLLNFPFGVFIGFAIAISVAWKLDSDATEFIQKNWTYGFSAFITLLAATIALIGVFSSIENQNTIAQKNRDSDLAAAKAVLPLALTRMSRIADRGFDHSLRGAEYFKDNHNLALVAADVDIPTEVISVFQNCIRAESSMAAKWISVLIARYQLAHSTLVRESSDITLIMDANRAEHAARWAIVAAITDHLWDFARGELQEPPENLDLSRIVMPIFSEHFGTAIGNLAASRITDYRRTFNSGRISDLEVKNPYSTAVE